MRLYVEFDLSPHNVFKTLIGISAFLLMLDVVVFSLGLSADSEIWKLIDITRESNLPTWFSSTQAILVGVIAYMVGRQRRLQAQRSIALGWFAIAAFFVYVGIDDASRIHERVASVLAEAALATDSRFVLIEAIKGFPSYYWLIIILPVFGVFGLFMLMFLWREFQDNETMVLFAAGIASYVVAVGLDYFDGVDHYYDVVLARTLLSFDQARHVARAIEEFIEMVGTAAILTAFLLHWQRIAGTATPGVSPAQG